MLFRSYIAIMPGARFVWSGVLSRSTTTPLPASMLRSFFTYTPSSAKSSLAQRTFFLPRSHKSIQARRFHAQRPLRSNATTKPPTPKPNSPAHGAAAEEAPSLSARLKKLTREYGWTALGVYFALSALDFPFCFLAVRALGTDRIGHYEHVVVQTFKNLIGRGDDASDAQAHSAATDIAQATAREGELGLAEDIEEAEARNQGASACKSASF